MRKYIAYGRKNVFPVLSSEIHEMLTELYIGLRKHNYGSNGKKLPISITPRQLEGLIRLSEAAARVRLSDTVDEEDARLAIQLVRFSLMNIGVDSETGIIDIDKILIGDGVSQREKIRILFEVAKELQKANNSRNIAIVDLIKGMVNRNIPESIAADYVDRMLKRGSLVRLDQEHVLISS